MPFYQFDSSGIVKRALIADGLPPLVFVSADDRLIAAAQSEGLTADYPHGHP